MPRYFAPLPRRAPGAAGIAADARAGLLGVLAVVLACLVAAIFYSGAEGEGYSPLRHWISELGEYGVSSFAAIFSAGLVVGGIGFARFQFALYSATTGRLRTVILAIGLISAAGGALVGILPMNIVPAHRLAAMTFFLLGWIPPLLVSIRLIGGSRDGLPTWLVIPGAAVVIAFLAFLVVLFGSAEPGGALGKPDERPAFWLAPTLEWATLITILLWTALVSLVLHRRARE